MQTQVLGVGESITARPMLLNNDGILLDKAKNVAASATLILTALAFSRWHVDSYELIKVSIFYAGVAVMLVLSLAEWLLLSAEKIKIQRSSLDASLAFFALAYALALVFSTDVQTSFWGQYRSYAFGAMPIFSGILWAWLLAQAKNSSIDKTICWSTAFASAIAGMYGLLQYTGFEFTGFLKHAGERVPSSFGNPLYFASYSVVAGFLMLGEIQESSRKNFVAWILLALIAVGWVLPMSRSAWMALAAGGVCFVFTGQKPKIWKILTAAVVLFVIVLALPHGRARLHSFASPDKADAARWEGWKGALKIAAQHPFLGSGPDTYVYAFRLYRSSAYVQATGSEHTQAHAHNDVLQMLSTAGIVGLAGWIFLIGKILYAGKRAAQTSARQRGVFAALLALLVFNQFNFSSIASWILFWSCLGILARKSNVGSYEFISADLKTRRIYFAAVAFLATAWVWMIARPVIADQHYFSSEQEIVRGNYEGGVKHLELAISATRRIAPYYQKLIDTFAGLAMMPNTEKIRPMLLNNSLVAAKEAANFIPLNPDCQNNLGVAYMWLTQFAGQNYKSTARSAFTKAVEMDPNFVDAWMNLARVAHFEGKIDEEISLWRKILTIDPQNDLARKILMQLERK